MKGLLLNDYYSIKKWWLFLIVLPFFPLFASLLALWGGSSDEVYISMLGIGFSVGFFIAFGAFYEVMKENESAQWMKQALVASVSRKEYMMEKYLFFIIISSFIGIINLVMAFISLIVSGNTDITHILKILAMPGVSLLFTILSSTWIIPVGVNWGLKKASMVFYVYFFASLGFIYISESVRKDMILSMRIAFFILITIASVMVFIMGWKWVEKREM